MAIARGFALLFIGAVFCAEASLAAGGYSLCQYADGGNPEIVCGNSCPAGSTLVAYNPGDIEQCTGNLVEGCEKIANLHYDLGWNGGHKTKFCRANGYDSVTNHPNSSYKEHGGGWCFKGQRAACTASLPSGI